MASEVTKDEWHEWCQHPVTQELFEYFQGKINDQTWDLVENAGTSSTVDAKTSGLILGWGELLNWKPESLILNIDRDQAVETVDNET